jgi:arabinan endo-1,5-alpha-L-arabinosidase
MTISAWVKPASGERKTAAILEKWDALEKDMVNGYSFRLLAGGRLSFGVPNPGSEGESNSSKKVPQEEWTFVAGVCDGETLKVYLNGVLDHTGLKMKTPLSSVSPLHIGLAGGGGAHCFLGSLDDVRLYNRALSPEEIAALAQGK